MLTRIIRHGNYKDTHNQKYIVEHVRKDGLENNAQGELSE